MSKTLARSQAGAVAAGVRRPLSRSEQTGKWHDLSPLATVLAAFRSENDSNALANTQARVRARKKGIAITALVLAATNCNGFSDGDGLMIKGKGCIEGEIELARAKARWIDLIEGSRL